MSIQANINSLIGMIGSTALKIKGSEFIKGGMREQQIAEQKRVEEEKIAEQKRAAAAEFKKQKEAAQSKQGLYDKRIEEAEVVEISDYEPEKLDITESELITAELGEKAAQELYDIEPTAKNYEQLSIQRRDTENLRAVQSNIFAAQRARAEEQARYQVQEEQERIRKARETKEENIRKKAEADAASKALREKILRGGV